MGAVTKVVIDTNIFISAFGWDGKPEAVLRLMEQRKVINFTTNDIYAELQRVVAYPKLKSLPPCRSIYSNLSFPGHVLYN